ncbi:MAG: alpha/beta fold hydrolase [Rhodospirillaceae bacterium]|nr:alpha/beta fold hydrolase [Rhodospirillaceae bacterium]
MAAASAAAASAAGAQTAQAQGQRKTYVLVHGAWHGGWCWRDVAADLRAAGHDVHVPTLTGLGERVHLMTPEVNLSTHVTDVVNLIAYEELNDVILVGHSYAGHVIPWVADKLQGRIRHQVYLDAVIARDGQPFLPPEVVAERARTAIKGYLQPPPEVTWFGVPADHPLAPWVARRLTNHSLNCLAETVRFANGGDAGLPKTFIRCLQRRDMSQPDPIEPMVKGKPEWTWLTLDTGHDAMITARAELSAMLLGIG